LAQLWAFVPAWLQAKRGSHMVITTIMLNMRGGGADRLSAASR
jgi:ABC-type uncharacterized transport system permease subunit